ncbi:hypothetical protein P3T73_02225 [Kiritimatiellota bacterium B12222]|nr:hypothetical protein P3T73_02225 [Kiritimatiellota bacterium B12222]
MTDSYADANDVDPLEAYEELYNDNKELLEAIQLLEEALPDIKDPVGIYLTLFDVFSEMENMTEAGQCLVEAAQRVDLESHADLIYFLYAQLELFAQLSPDAQAAYERLGEFISEDDGTLNANTTYLDQRKLYQVDLVPEILLTNHLHRSRIITDPEYQICLQELCQLSANAPSGPQSCLSALDTYELPHALKAVEFLAHDAATPFINLELINIDPLFFEQLSPEFCIRRGACVFGEVGGEPLVAILNPFNLQLKEDVARLLDSTPHFYLTSSAAYLSYLELQQNPSV